MFASGVLDVAIGLVFIYFFFSLLCSVIVEGIAALSKWRPKELYGAIKLLLDDDETLEKLYKNPLFLGTSPEDKTTPKKKRSTPSYISSSSFVMTLLESLKEREDVAHKFLNPQISIPDGSDKTKEFTDALNRLQPGDKIKDELEKLLKAKAFKNQEALDTLVNWYKTKMDKPDEVKNMLESQIRPPERVDQIENFKKELKKLPETRYIREKLEPLLESAKQDQALADINKWYGDDKEILKDFNTQIPKEILKYLKPQFPSLNSVDNIKELLGALPDDNKIKKALVPLLESANDDFEKALANMEKWYDEAMDRLTGWYKRYSQWWALGLAFVIALVLNADTFEISKKIYHDKGLRDAVVAMAVEDMKSRSSTSQQSTSRTPSTTPQKPKDTQSTVQKNPDNLEFIKKNAPKLPLGWPGYPKEGLKIDLNLAGQIFMKFLGIVFTAFLVSLGFNFWFELLNKLVNMRSAGNKPLTREQLEAQRRQAVN